MRYNVRWYFLAIIWLVVLGGIIAFLGTVKFSLAMPTAGIVYSTIQLIFCQKKHIDAIAKIGTPFFIILLIGAIVGFGYAMSGGSPLFEFPNHDTRMNRFFLTTCTNSPFVPIRPSGVYDEPGTFSFYLCIFAVFRVLSGKNDILTYLMLLAGNITFSAVHAIFFAFYHVYLLGKYYRKKLFLAYIAVTVMAASFMVYQYYDVFEVMLFARFQDGKLTQNNRSVQIDEVLKMLESSESLTNVALFGDPRIENIDQDLYTNPFGPMVKDGLFASWIYYACMAVLLFGGGLSKRYRFVFWAIAMVYAQRPYYMGFGNMTALYIVTFAAASMAYSQIKSCVFRRRTKSGAESLVHVPEI
jgi:hypothetical protein